MAVYLLRSPCRLHVDFSADCRTTRGTGVQTAADCYAQPDDFEHFSGWLLEVTSRNRTILSGSETGSLKVEQECFIQNYYSNQKVPRSSTKWNGSGSARSVLRSVLSKEHPDTRRSYRLKLAACKNYETSFNWD